MSKKTLEVIDVNKFYGDFQALNNINFHVDEGEIVGFIGPNGAGKSTMMKCINTLIHMTSGEIKICGKSVKKDREQALQYMSSTIENPGLHTDMTGYENIRLFCILRCVDASRIDEIVDFVGIGDFIHKKVKTYSLGMKQRLALGIVMIGKPKFIILDEPTNGLDPSGVIDLRNTLISLAHNEKVSILFSSHQLGEMARIADRIVCIKNGQLIPFHSKIMDRAKYIFEMTAPISSEIDFSSNDQVFFTKVYDNKIELHVNRNLEIGEIVKTLLEFGSIKSISNEEVSIEDIYTDIFNEGIQDD